MADQISESRVLDFLSAPKFISVVPAEFHQGIIYEPHVHDYAEIVLITNGRGIQKINGKEYDVKCGDIVLLDQFCMHAERTAKEDCMSLITCKLDNVLINGFRPGQLLPDNKCPVVAAESSYETISNIYKDLLYEKNFPDEYSDELICCKINELFCHVFRKFKNARLINEPAKKIDNIINTIRQYLDEHYAEDISLEDLSDRFYISVSFLVHAFKREIGTSPINYIINRRVGEAQRYLSFTQKPISEISELIGYDNVSHFNRVFLKRTGFQPSVFRDLYSWKDHIDDDTNNYL